MSRPKTRAEFDRELTEALCEIEDGLTDWEAEFADSIAKALIRYGSLTDAQRAKALQVAECQGLTFGEVPDA